MMLLWKVVLFAQWNFNCVDMENIIISDFSIINYCIFNTLNNNSILRRPRCLSGLCSIKSNLIRDKLRWVRNNNNCDSLLLLQIFTLMSGYITIFRKLIINYSIRLWHTISVMTLNGVLVWLKCQGEVFYHHLLNGAKLKIDSRK